MQAFDLRGSKFQGDVYFPTTDYNLFAQDTWKVNRRLTLNYGLRWEPYLSNENITGQVNHFDQALFDRGFQSKIMLNAPPCGAYSSFHVR